MTIDEATSAGSVTSTSPVPTAVGIISGLPLSPTILVAAITLVAFLLRVAALDNDSLWFDTAHSGVVALNPTLGEVIHGAATDYQSPLYFVLLHFWLSVSTSDFWLRLLTVIAGTAIIPMSYAAGKRFFSTNAGLVAALFCAITSYQVYFSRYPRGYILVAFLALAAAYCMHRACEGREGQGAGNREQANARWWVLHGICVVLALYTHPYTFFMLPALWGYGLWRAFRQRDLILPLFVTTGAVLVAYVPWFGVSWGQWGQVQAGADAWIEPASRDALKTLYDWLWFKTRSEYSLPVDLLLKGGRYAFTALLVWSLWRNRGSRDLWWIVALSVGTAAIVFVFSALLQPLWDPRYLVILSPFMALWLGKSVADLLELSDMRMRLAGLGAVGLMVVMAAPPMVSMYTDKAFFAPDIRGSAAWVRGQYQPGDAIVHINYQSYLPALWYDQQAAHEVGSRTVAHAVPCIWESLPDTWCSQAPYPESYVNLDLQSFPQAVQGQKHIWLVVLYNHNKVGEQEKTDALASMLAGQGYGVARKESFLGVNVFELKQAQFGMTNIGRAQRAAPLRQRQRTDE